MFLFFLPNLPHFLPFGDAGSEKAENRGGKSYLMTFFPRRSPGPQAREAQGWASEVGMGGAYVDSLWHNPALKAYDWSIASRMLLCLKIDRKFIFAGIFSATQRVC
jgi:hypothetical protein